MKTIRENGTVVVPAPEITSAVTARFARANQAQPNLMSREGLPAASFRSDAPPFIP